MYNGSSFNGNIKEIPEIFVDNFTDTNRKAYFLSHCHLDHIQGLFRYKLVNDLAKNNAKIYMTEASMKIVIYSAASERNNEIGDYIQPLKLGTTTVTVGDKHIEVTLIPAGHCIGSVMFMFRISNKTILYTGDFRMRQNDVDKYAQLHDKNGDPIKIDVMYLDTTFIHDDHPEFAKRSDSVEEALEKIDIWLKDDDSNRVALHTSAKYGYEFVFHTIYKRLGLRVYVNDYTWGLYTHFPDILRALTNSEPDPKIHLCKPIQYRYQCQHDVNYNYLSVFLSARSWRNYFEEDQACGISGSDVLKVCYATHCSRSELIYFVDYMDPVKVEGFPYPYNPDVKETVYEDSFTPKKKKLKVNEVSEERKVDEKLLKELFEI